MTQLVIETPKVFRPLLAPARYKGGRGGRGSGKSHFFAELLIEEHICNAKQASVAVRETQKTLQYSVKRLLEQKIAALNAGWYFEVQNAVIKNKLGDGLIIFQGMQEHTKESIKSLEGYDRAWVEEAQTLSRGSLDMLRPTIRKQGSQVWFSWNPRHATDPVDEFMRAAPPADSITVEAHYYDNPWFDQTTMRADMEYDRERDPDKYAHIWLGEYVRHSEARVFRNWKVEEFEAPPDAIHRQGADWGFASDPTVLVRCHIVGRKLYVDYEAYSIGCEIADTPALFMQVPDSERWPITADSARPETISHMRAHGFPKIMSAVKGAKSLEEGVAWLQSFDIIVHPRCRNTIDELTLYSYKVDPHTQQVTPLLQDRKNHVIDALRYACEGVRRANKVTAPPPVVPIPTQHYYN
jgi:phage terminase large subunit